MNIHIMPTDKIGQFVADIVEAQLKEKPEAVLGMTTGNTPLNTGIFKELIQRENKGKIDFSKSIFINPDEQLGIPKEHSLSYYTYMRQNFIDHLSHPQKSWYIPDGAAEDPQAECERMENAVHKVGGIDWQLMGLGINGHICFIEPNTAIPASCYVTHIAEVNRRLYAKDFGTLDAVPTHAITFGLGTVLKSRSLCLVVEGERKADIVAKALLHPVTTEIPATILQMSSNATIVLDEAAASKLPENLGSTKGHLYKVYRY